MNPLPQLLPWAKPASCVARNSPLAAVSVKNFARLLALPSTMRRIGISWIRERRLDCAKRRRTPMTSTGRRELFKQVDKAVNQTSRKFFLTEAEVIGVLVLQVAHHARHHLEKYDEQRNKEDDEEEDED